MKNFKRLLLKQKYRLLLLSVSILILLVFSTLFDNKVFSVHFVDEEDYEVLASYMNQGQKLYTNLFSVHQPAAYKISQLIQKIDQPANDYLLIKHHREFIIVWSVVWSILLIWRFGWGALLVVSLIELNKIYLLGNLFLSESLAIYPLIYTTCLVMFKIPKRKELILIGACLGLLLMLLSPLWPFVVFLIGIILFKNYSRLNLILLLVGLIPTVIIFLINIPLNDYIHQVFYTNFVYNIPDQVGDKGLKQLIKSFIYPVLVLRNFNPSTPVLELMRILSILLIFNFVIMLKNKQYLLGLLILAGLGISNLRFIIPNLTYYDGFHLLPYLSLLTMMTVFISINTLNNEKGKNLKIIIITLLGVSILTSLFNAQDSLFVKHNLAQDFYINYSHFEDINRAVSIMRGPNDTLFVTPDDVLIYFPGDIAHASFLMNYYPWMENTPELKIEVNKLFAISKPTFVYCTCQNGFVKTYLGNYQELKKDNKLSQLFVLNKKIESLTSKQKNELRFYHFNE